MPEMTSIEITFYQKAVVISENIRRHHINHTTGRIEQLKTNTEIQTAAFMDLIGCPFLQLFEELSNFSWQCNLTPTSLISVIHL